MAKKKSNKGLLIGIAILGGFLWWRSRAPNVGECDFSITYSFEGNTTQSDAKNFIDDIIKYDINRGGLNSLETAKILSMIEQMSYIDPGSMKCLENLYNNHPNRTMTLLKYLSNPNMKGDIEMQTAFHRAMINLQNSRG